MHIFKWMYVWICPKCGLDNIEPSPDGGGGLFACSADCNAVVRVERADDKTTAVSLIDGNLHELSVKVRAIDFDESRLISNALYRNWVRID